MITNEQLPDVVGAAAYDGSGDKVGKVGNIYYDNETNEPKWLTVHTGLFGGNETFVPMDGADLVGDGRVTLAYGKDMIEDAPNVDEDGSLSPEEEQQLYRYYHLDGDTDTAVHGRTNSNHGTTNYSSVDRGDAGVDDHTTSDHSTTNYSSVGDNSGVDDHTTSDHTTTNYSSVDHDDAVVDTTGRTDTVERTGSQEFEEPHSAREENREGTFDGRKQPAVGHDTSGPVTDGAMTRSEEQLRVGTQTREIGRARLRKRVVTETEQATVPVSHEELTIEREPITEANRGDAYDGPAISEEEHEVVLREERPVVDTEAVAVERIRMGTNTVRDNETVSGEVRKEVVAVDHASDTRGEHADLHRDERDDVRDDERNERR